MNSLVEYYAIRIYNEIQYSEIIQLLYSYGFHWQAGNHVNYIDIDDNIFWVFFKIPSKTISYANKYYEFEKGDFQIFSEECEQLLKLKSIL